MASRMLDQAPAVKDWDLHDEFYADAANNKRTKRKAKRQPSDRASQQPSKRHLSAKVRTTSVDELNQVAPTYRIRRFVLFMLVLLLIVVSVWLVYQKHAERFMIAAVNIQNELHSQQAFEVEQTLLPHVHGSFFSIDLSRAQQALVELSWVKSASLRRQWPDQIAVFIEPYVPVARWNDQAYIDAYGTVFEREQPFETIDIDRLPQLSGNTDVSVLVLTNFAMLQKRLSSLGLQATSLTRDERNSWQFVTSDGITVKLGRQNLQQRLERFIVVYQQVTQPKSSTSTLTSIDLRYHNGVALQWQGAE